MRSERKPGLHRLNYNHDEEKNQTCDCSGWVGGSLWDEVISDGSEIYWVDRRLNCVVQDGEVVPYHEAIFDASGCQLNP